MKQCLVDLNKSLTLLFKTYVLHEKISNLKRAVIKTKNDWIMSNCHSMNGTCASIEGTKVFWNTVNKLKTGLKKNNASVERPMKKTRWYLMQNA